jgi:glucokinase
MILAGDIGGTKSHLALFSESADGLVFVREHLFHSSQFASIEALTTSFLGTEAGLTAVALGIPGPVVEGRARATNLPWSVDSVTLRDALHIDHVSLLNDLEATAYGIATLTPGQLCTVNAGVCKPGNMALIAAGTGLGEAALHWDGQQHWPSPSEGGHSDFAPRNAIEIELLQWLIEQFGHVSWERVLSGPGLSNLYQFLRDTGKAPESPVVAQRMAKSDPNAVITELGLAESDPLCVKALDLFVTLYGSEAGNLALKTLSLGGVYVGGGIAPRISKKFSEPAFFKAFHEKGRMQELLLTMPLYVILDPNTGLYGAAAFALRSRGLVRGQVHISRPTTPEGTQ